jgi:hypothetical protein
MCACVDAAHALPQLLPVRCHARRQAGDSVLQASTTRASASYCA